MAKDINIHIKTPGAAQAKQQLEGVGKASQQVGDKTSHGARKGADGMDKLSQSATSTEGRFSKLTRGLATWAAGLFGITAIIAGVTKAIRIQGEALKEHAQIAAEQQKKLLSLQAMGTFFEEHPEARKEVAAYAELGRRPFEDVAEAWYALESKGAGLTKEQKAGIMREALELGRMEPEAELKSIVDVLSFYAKETRQKNINQIQNVIRQTLSQAGAELSQLGRYLPEFLSLGITGGLTGAEAAGLWAFATTRAPTPEKATVGIRNIFMALQGKGTPESQKLLQGLGITPEMNIFQQLFALSAAQRAGGFGLPEAEIVAMKENAAILMSMLTEPAAMMGVVRQVTRVDRPDIDITADKLKQIMGTDKFARMEDRRRQLDVEIQNIKGQDIKALEWDVYLKEYEKEMREVGVSEYIIQYQLFKYRQAAGFGAEPGRQWLLEPSGGIAPKFSRPFSEFPEAPLAEPGGGVVIVNDNSINTNLNPIAGTNEDRGIGTRGFSPGVY